MAQKNMAVAYLLWFLLGGFGVHRAYLGDTMGFGIYLMLWVISVFLLVIGVGAITLVALCLIWLIDICLIPGLVRDANNKQQPIVVIQQVTPQQQQFQQQQQQPQFQQPQYQQQFPQQQQPQPYQQDQQQQQHYQPQPQQNSQPVSMDY
jgi:TM2 domain-containing membrane protein YozV